MKDKYRIFIYKCPEYDKESIKNILDGCLNDLEGIKDKLAKAKNILIKPNLLMPASPEQAITTHPVFIEAVIESVASMTGRPRDILMADSFSPVVPFTEKGIHRVYEETGLKDISKRTGCRLSYSTEYSTVSNPEGKFLKQIE